MQMLFNPASAATGPSKSDVLDGDQVPKINKIKKQINNKKLIFSNNNYPHIFCFYYNIFNHYLQAIAPTSPWANMLSVGLKILTAFLGGGNVAGDGIDKVDNSSPMQVKNNSNEYNVHKIYLQKMVQYCNDAFLYHS